MAHPDFFDSARCKELDVRIVAVDWKWGHGAHRSAQMDEAARVLSMVPEVQCAAWTMTKVCTIHRIDGPSSVERSMQSEYRRVWDSLQDVLDAASRIKIGGKTLQNPVLEMRSHEWDWLIGEAELKARELLAPLGTHQCDGRLCC